MYPINICSGCFRNIVDSYNFIKNCLKSNQIIEEKIQELTTNGLKDEIEVKQSDNENDEAEHSETEQNDGMLRIDTEDSSESSETDSDKPKPRKTRRTGIKRQPKEKKKVKSQKFDCKLILQAIAEFREIHKDKYEKTCRFCQLETVSYIALATHIANFHK